VEFIFGSKTVNLSSNVWLIEVTLLMKVCCRSPNGRGDEYSRRAFEKKASDRAEIGRFRNSQNEY